MTTTSGEGSYQQARRLRRGGVGNTDSHLSREMPPVFRFGFPRPLWS